MAFAQLCPPTCCSIHLSHLPRSPTPTQRTTRGAAGWRVSGCCRAAWRCTWHLRPLMQQLELALSKWSSERGSQSGRLEAACTRSLPLHVAALCGSLLTAPFLPPPGLTVQWTSRWRMCLKVR